MLTLVGNRDGLFKEWGEKVKNDDARHRCVLCRNLWTLYPDYFSCFKGIRNKLPAESEAGEVVFVKV